jgi:radical SAM superfamily enzyme YgiQ (UPF0313 family)
MDIVLLNSGTIETQATKVAHRTLGPYKLANQCRKNGYSVKVIEHIAHFSKEELMQALTMFVTRSTRILGLSTTFIANSGTIPSIILESIVEISQIYPKLKIILGGYNSLIAKKIKEFDIFGIVENSPNGKYCEDTFIDVVDFIFKKSPEPKFSIEINQYTKKVIKSYKEPVYKRYNIELDDFTFHKDDNIVPGEALPLEISRGCIFKCKFCNHLMIGRSKLDYLRSFELIKAELTYNYNQWGTTSYYIICDTFNDTVYKMAEWHKMILSLPFKIQYAAYLRADLLDKNEEVPYMLKESGLVAAFHGIETFNIESANAIDKGWSAKRAKDYIPELYHNIWKSDICQTLSFIVGLPGDTKEDNFETLQWFIDNKLYHILFHPLLLTYNPDVRFLSEFDKKYLNYGYKFDKSEESSGVFNNWYNDYWTYKEVLNFVKKELYPKLGYINNGYSSWEVPYFLGLGKPMGFLKSPNKKLSETNRLTTEYLFKYKKLLFNN